MPLQPTTSARLDHLLATGADGPEIERNRRLTCGFIEWSLGDSNP